MGLDRLVMPSIESALEVIVVPCTPYMVGNAADGPYPNQQLYN